MAYILEQYNKRPGSGDDTFMKFVDPNLVSDNAAVRIRLARDYNVDNTVVDPIIFKDEAVKFSFDPKNLYYFHGKIKKMNTKQIFDIKLYNENEVNDSIKFREQYIKTIEIAKGDVFSEQDDSEVDRYDIVTPEWVDIEFIIKPQISFTHLAFDLQRDVTDYRDQVRYPIIAYEELSKVENFFDPIKGQIIKIGIQSRPGLLMAINEDEIRTNRTGIYEMKSGLVTIYAFSVCSAGIEQNLSMSNWIANINNQIAEIEIANKEWHDSEHKRGMSDKQAEEAKSNIHSFCFFNTDTYPKTRAIDAFTLDYLYKNNE